jgi:hypothetical protein
MLKRDPRSAPPPGTIDFELTDISDARAAHDLLPPGIEQMELLRKPQQWQDRRRPMLATDRAMTGRSLDWLMRLPPAVRPNALCTQFPRIANTISESWHVLDESLAVFDHLLHDRRTGRRGFPAEVRREIEALCKHRLELG